MADWADLEIDPDVVGGLGGSLMRGASGSRTFDPAVITAARAQAAKNLFRRKLAARVPTLARPGYSSALLLDQIAQAADSSEDLKDALQDALALAFLSSYAYDQRWTDDDRFQADGERFGAALNEAIDGLGEIARQVLAYTAPTDARPPKVSAVALTFQR